VHRVKFVEKKFTSFFLIKVTVHKVRFAHKKKLNIFISNLGTRYKMSNYNVQGGKELLIDKERHNT
jgi:hypothetical protein